MAERSRQPYQTLPEVKERIPTRVEGMLPGWLNGSLARVGPGLFEFGEHKALYPMDGMGLVHLFNIEDGQATYQSKLIDSETYKKNRDAQRFTVAEFGTPPNADPSKGFFAKMKDKLPGGGEVSDNANHNLFYWKENKALLVIGSPMYVIDPKTLETIGKVKVPEKLGADIITEHVHIDKDGTLYLLASHVRGRPTYHIVKVPATGNLETSFASAEIFASVNGQFMVTPTSHHIFFMTENYFVVVESPLEIDVVKILAKNTILDCLHWDPKVTSKFHVISRKDGKAMKCKIECNSMHLLHSSNAYEDGDHIVIDACIFNTLKSHRDLFTSRKELCSPDCEKNKPWRKLDINKAVRFVIPTNEQKIAEAKAGDNVVDLEGETAKAVLQPKLKLMKLSYRPLTAPREDKELLQYPNISPSLSAKKYTYFYAGGCGESDFLRFGIGKYNVMTQEVNTWEAKDYQYLTEPLFIADPQGTAEDDGVLMFTMLDYSDNNDRLMVVDAKSMTTIAQVFIEAQDSGPVLLPEADHGVFIPSD